jgi:hypothetical protein
VLLHCRHGEGVGAMCPVRVRGTGEAASTELACGGQMRELRGGGGGRRGSSGTKLSIGAKMAASGIWRKERRRYFFRAVAYGSC